MKALALISGGLDSLLAARLVKDQGIGIIALNFHMPFCSREEKFSYGCPDSVRAVADYLGVELKVINIVDEFLSVLENPGHGYGANLNPCIDCKILMLRKCKELLEEFGAGFVVTGEVLGQRPMSQHRQALVTIEKESGIEGLILRPLCAKLLEETIPEKNKWVDRVRLLDLNGRSRKPQMQLARDFGFHDYANPAGGCLLTDPRFAIRVKDLISHKELDAGNVELLKVGRHFRVSDRAKLVVGRDEKENERLLGLARRGDFIFMPPDDVAGATALGRGAFNDELIRGACAITGRYFDRGGNPDAEISYKIFPDEREYRLTVPVMREEDIVKLRI
ncbi:MAG: hypothetical protein PHN57_02930 [Candidatus Omnitrophica bacterium]|nr:hypothetical protein [Candidatus Omnitrophota bacterium]